MMVGAPMKIKPLRLPVPPGVVTSTLPDVPLSTVAAIRVAEITLKDVAATPPKLTAVAPVKLVPVIITVAPWPAEAGVKLVTVGARAKMKQQSNVAPAGVTTTTFPEAPLPTVAVICVAETTRNDAAAVPPKRTAVALMKLVPVIVTIAPWPAETGAKLVMVGVEMKVKPHRLEEPPGVGTLTLPEAPAPTLAVIRVYEVTLNAAAGTPPKLTAVVPAKLVPVMMTVAPWAAEAGAKLVIVGAGMKVK